MSKSSSKRIGELFAHIQDLLDTTVHTIIKRVNEGDSKTKGLLRFFSSIGDAYFKKYSEIKKDTK